MLKRSTHRVHFNPRSADFHARMPQIYGALNGNGPISRTAAGVWLVTGYEAAREAFVCPSLRRIHPAIGARIAPEHREIVDFLAASLFGQERPYDIAIRTTMKRLFTRENVERHRITAADRARELLHALPRDRKIDAIDDLALPFTLTVLRLMMGLPQGCEKELRYFTEGTLALGDAYPTKAENAIAARDAIGRARPIFEAALADSSRHEGSLAHGLSRLVRDGQITLLEAVANMGITFSAGHDTTISLIAQTLVELSADRALIRQASACGDGLATLVEEAMRFHSPVQIVARRAVESFRFRETDIRQGDHLMIVVGAANRDPTVFASPDEFRLDRKGQARSLGFGFGSHLCVGEQLARLHTATMIEAVLREAPHFRCTHDNSKWRSTAILHYPLDCMLLLGPPCAGPE